MFPAPTTIAISTPCPWSSAISAAMRSTSWRSRPYSLSPIRASPESFSSTRLNAGLPFRSACKGVALVLEHLELVLVERLRDSLAGVVDPLLVGQDALAEEALREHALDDLVAVLLGTRLHLRQLGEDLTLRRQVVLGDLAARRIHRCGEGDVHRQQARDLCRALRPDEDANLVRRRVDVCRKRFVAVLLLEPAGAAHDDVLADLSHELLALVLQLVDGVGTLLLDGVQGLLSKGEELLVLRDRLRLAPDGDERAHSLAHPRKDDPLGRLTAGALPRLRHPPLAEELLGRVEIALGLLQRALGVHHPGAGLVAQLLHERGRNLRHQPAPSAPRSRARPGSRPPPRCRSRPRSRPDPSARARRASRRRRAPPRRPPQELPPPPAGRSSPRRPRTPPGAPATCRPRSPSRSP